jgi:hypothetical protein
MFCAVLAGAVLAGCAAVPMGTNEEDELAKSFVARPGKANIYLYRPETLGFAAPIAVAVNGRFTGKTLGQTYLMLQVDPGEHEIASLGEDMATLRLRAQAGRSYYVWQEVKVGMWKVRSRLHEVDEAVGRSGVGECRIVKPGI